MSTGLKKAYIDYATIVRSELIASQKERDLDQPIAVLMNKKTQLRTMTERLEGSHKFNFLVRATRDAFSRYGHGTNESSWLHAVRNVFRRSGFYCDIYENRSVDLDNGFDRYCEAFTTPEIVVLYLSPLEYVEFSEKSMDFGRFQIKRFAKERLDSLLGNNVSEIFYPWAVVDSTQLRDYWFIYVRETVQAPKVGIFQLPLWGRVGVRYTPFPKALAPVVQLLALFEWQADYWRGSARNETAPQASEEGWQGFNVPFVLRVHDNLYESPVPCPSFAMLSKEPEFDPYTGEEIGERPEVHIHLDEQETDSFKAFVRHSGDILAKLSLAGDRWHFFEIALGTLTKAFFADNLDQLLWHITALEALLGERGDELTEKLARRLAAMLGKTEREKKDLKRRFKQLYAFRSDLVHGNRFGKEVYWGHLREDRDFARRSLNWFLSLLGTIQDEISRQGNAAQFPKRDVILGLLDMNEGQRSQTRTLIDILPPAFPYIEEWIA